MFLCSCMLKLFVEAVEAVEAASSSVSTERFFLASKRVKAVLI